MKRANRVANAVVGGCLALSVLGTGGLVMAKVADASPNVASLMESTATVNLRSGPSTDHAILRVLAPAEEVRATETQGEWRRVTTSRSEEGWVHQDYLRMTIASPTIVMDITPTPAPAPVPSGEVTTTAAVNVRTGPGTDHRSLGLVPAGTTLPTTGKLSGEWTEVIHEGQARWIFSAYLTTGKPTTSKPVGKVRTTANLYLRTGGDLGHPYTGVLPANSVVDTTGNTTADYTEIIHGGQNRWIATRYTAPVTENVAPQPSPAPVPEAKSTVWVSVGELYVRAGSAADSEVVDTVRRNDALKTTEVVEGDRLQIIHKGALRWVFKAYTTTVDPTTVPETPKQPLDSRVSLPGYDKLRPNAKNGVQHVIQNYPQIKVIGGWRSGSNYSDDHPNGRAIDVMIPNWSSQSGIDLGDAIAQDFLTGASGHKVSYIIWRQKIWNASWPQRGWRWMEDRGSYTQNHYDHVHISFRD